MATDVRDEVGYNPNQHCTALDCMTFSHTAKYCGMPQPRRCPCPFDYSDEVKIPVGTEDIANSLRDYADDPGSFRVSPELARAAADLLEKAHTEGDLWAYERLVREQEFGGSYHTISVDYISARATVEREHLERISCG